ncbi:hypothetical protein EST38_g7639 [Candolleomyces aberdarensis]|uniref:Uncharacterized protein n=1 Tax=Candolleomyces aberdarensis TaxID=2316362 RepID=A0A4Q2DGW3_9AGAR|nr:hypothetical protein EST38_g7639 [Candolleomyces aberdarensis]
MTTIPSPSMYTPSIEDVFAVRRHLLNFVPAEIAVVIVELAEYFPKVSATREAFTGPASVPGIRRDGEWCYVLSPPLPSRPGVTMKPREVKFTLDCAAGCTYDSICSSSTTFNAAIVKAKDLTQNILYEPLEAAPERHINDWTISDPTRWLVQEVPLSWPVGSRHELAWKDVVDEDAVDNDKVNAPATSADAEPEAEAEAGAPSGTCTLAFINRQTRFWRSGRCHGAWHVTTEIYYSI